MNETFDYARYDRIRPLLWTGDALQLLDQRKLPFVVEHLTCGTSDEVAAAIHALAVRGAPAIGIAAAWGAVLAGRAIEASDGAEAALKLEPALQRLNAARPTAVNLAWALARMRRALQPAGADWREDILLLDGGATPGPVPSTIVTLAGAHACAPRILRQGVLALADLERVAGVALSEGTAGAGRDRTEAGA